ncbi:molybdopterin-dependent oxidoreductase [Maricaulis sp.]|uniref:molybdopterin-dependent oxidoreductase n=1 Tax=Maricaulis sp. TaxID=1486257 RepID=UPI00262CBF2E|nr:molybdopterin-dependent oxidoreductase [Maricaulis sp.]
MRWIMGLVAGLALMGCQAPTNNGEDSADIITIYGEIATVDRGAMDPLTEPLFNTFGIEFDAACVINTAALLTLEQHAVRADFPAGHSVRNFSGPLLRDVLAIAVPTGQVLVITSVDGYQREIALQRIYDHDVILAIRMEGDPLPMGGFGPAMLVWPRRDDPALTGMNDDDWSWGVIAIEVR